ncbi:MAG: hypothetical protein S0880_07425 [Actinomycetota bacterium]|nr:hypothetical protein [Actinomycetota bacterium]
MFTWTDDGVHSFAIDSDIHPSDPHYTEKMQAHVYPAFGGWLATIDASEDPFGCHVALHQCREDAKLWCDAIHTGAIDNGIDTARVYPTFAGGARDLSPS